MKHTVYALLLVHAALYSAADDVESKFASPDQLARSVQVTATLHYYRISALAATITTDPQCISYYGIAHERAYMHQSAPFSSLIVVSDDQALAERVVAAASSRKQESWHKLFMSVLTERELTYFDAVSPLLIAEIQYICERPSFNACDPHIFVPKLFCTLKVANKMMSQVYKKIACDGNRPLFWAIEPKTLHLCTAFNNDVAAGELLSRNDSLSRASLAQRWANYLKTRGLVGIRFDPEQATNSVLELFGNHPLEQVPSRCTCTLL
jgi:hypothetical protein